MEKIFLSLAIKTDSIEEIINAITTDQRAWPPGGSLGKLNKDSDTSRKIAYKIPKLITEMIEATYQGKRSLDIVRLV